MGSPADSHVSWHPPPIIAFADTAPSARGGPLCHVSPPPFHLETSCGGLPGTMHVPLICVSLSREAAEDGKGCGLPEVHTVPHSGAQWLRDCKQSVPRLPPMGCVRRTLRTACMRAVGGARSHFSAHHSLPGWTLSLVWFQGHRDLDPLLPVYLPDPQGGGRSWGHAE